MSNAANQVKKIPANFTANGVKWFEPCGNDFVYQFIGGFGGGAIAIEEAAIDWDAIGMPKDTWAADTSVDGLWTSVTISGVPIQLTGPSGSNYINTPKRYIRARLSSSTSPDIVGQFIVFKP